MTRAVIVTSAVTGGMELAGKKAALPVTPCGTAVCAIEAAQLGQLLPIFMLANRTAASPACAST
jgi:hypothetical protein